MPTDERNWKVIEGDRFTRVFDADAPRVKTEWSAELTSPEDNQRFRGRRALALPEFCIQAWYFDLVSMSIDGVTWMVGERFDQPVHALDKEGKLVAIVMGMRPESLVAVPCATGATEGSNG